MMKKLVLSLLGAATVAISSNAMALDPGRYAVFVDRGQSATPAGFLMAQFDADIPFSGCEYAAEWDNATTGFSLSAECFLVETKTHGNFSCLQNSLQGIPALVTNDMTLPCTGFDYFGQFRMVQSIMLGESPAPWVTLGPPVAPNPPFPRAVLQGLIVFAGPAGYAYGFSLTPV
jgi:hypothetical protein